jgi:signal transduction histidine kinase
MLYFLNHYLSDENGIHHIGPFQLSKLYPDIILCVLSYIFYFKFGRLFVEAKTRYPSIDRLMITTEKYLFIYIGIEIMILTFLGNPVWRNWLFLPVNLSIFIVLIYVFIVMIRKNEVLDRFILTGSMFYGLSAFVTLWAGFKKPPLDDDHFLALQIGALVEMIFLNAGLVYKSRMLQRQTVESQRQLIERYKENQELLMRLGSIRGRISRDLHDDVGASLSSIKAYSEILKTDPKNLMIADLISNNSTEMIESLELIAWSTNPTHDHFGSLKSMMRKFAVPICHAKNIEFGIDCNNVKDDLEIPGETRQNLFMIFKEAINNMIKYAEATSCSTGISISGNRFIMEISDNGKGFDGFVKGNGNGMINMQKRAALLQGTFKAESKPEGGCSITTTLEYPFNIPDSWDIK